jgi:hypothetical protein
LLLYIEYYPSLQRFGVGDFHALRPDQNNVLHHVIANVVKVISGCSAISFVLGICFKKAIVSVVAIGIGSCTVNASFGRVTKQFILLSRSPYFVLLLETLKTTFYR